MGVIKCDSSKLYIQFISLLTENETRPHNQIKLISVFREKIAIHFEKYPLIKWIAALTTRHSTATRIGHLFILTENQELLSPTLDTASYYTT